jgi:tetratricopeptide (TPR) repeat protein
MIFVQRKEEDQAQEVFRELLSRTEHGVNTYRTIGSTLSRHGYFDLALRYYEEGRRRNNNNYILTLDLAYLYKTMGNYEESLAEYLFLIETAPRQHRLARTKILELVREPNADQAAMLTMLEESARQKAPYRGQVLAVLATAYLERGFLESALEAALQAEEKGGANGDVLFRLADQTLKEYERLPDTEKPAYFDLALRSLEAYLDGYPASAHVPRAKLMLIDLLVDLASGRVQGGPDMEIDAAVEKSLEALDWLIESFPGTEHAEQAYLKKGDVVFRLQKDPQEALEIYKIGMRRARFYPTAFAERLGRVYLIIEEYDTARTHFATLIRSSSEELRETGIYYSGLMLGFQRQYETARDTLTGLAEENPSSQFTNDAIYVAWIIEEGLQGEQHVLHKYMGGLKAELAGDTTAVISGMREITKLPDDTPLRPRALIKLGEMYHGSGRYQLAIDIYEQFVLEYPHDQELPDVQRKIGLVYEHGYGNTELALKKYENILVAYPHYLFLDEVRADVTRLRGSTGE